VMEWTILWIMLRRWLFTIFTTIVRTERFEITSSLALETYAAPHIWREDFVNE
jgi:hypothetical protein